MSSFFRSSLIPSFENTFGIIPSSSNATFLIVISDFVIAASPINEPISIMSGSILCVHPFKFFTPSIVIKFEPIPEIFAPIELSILHNC